MTNSADTKTYYGPICNSKHAPGGCRITSYTNGVHTNHFFSTVAAARNFLRAERRAA